jgi:hypothetical protein
MHACKIIGLAELGIQAPIKRKKKKIRERKKKKKL